MIDNTPTCENTIALYEDGREIPCGEPATHAVANRQDGVVIYRCDKHCMGRSSDDNIWVPYCTPVTLEEAILIEVMGG